MMSNEKEVNWKRLVGWVSIAVVLAWLFIPYLFFRFGVAEEPFEGDLSVGAQIGSMFGVVGALFSALTMGVIIVTFWMQRDTLEKSNKVNARLANFQLVSMYINAQVAATKDPVNPINGYEHAYRSYFIELADLLGNASNIDDISEHFHHKKAEIRDPFYTTLSLCSSYIFDQTTIFPFPTPEGLEELKQAATRVKQTLDQTIPLGISAAGAEAYREIELAIEKLKDVMSCAAMGETINTTEKDKYKDTITFLQEASQHLGEAQSIIDEKTDEV